MSRVPPTKAATSMTAGRSMVSSGLRSLGGTNLEIVDAVYPGRDLGGGGIEQTDARRSPFSTRALAADKPA